MKFNMLSGLTANELAARTWRKANEDGVFGHAAELAYYFLLALFPMLIFLTSLVGFLDGLRDAIFSALAKVVPGEAMSLVNQTILDVTRNRSGSLISFGVLGALWAASGGMSAMMGTLNLAYGAKEERSFWKTRLISIGLTVLLSMLIVIGTALIMFGDRLGENLAAHLGMGRPFTLALRLLDYLLSLAIIFFCFELIYYFAPNVKQDWKWITPGAIVAIVSLIVASVLFSVYLRFAPSYSATYGSLGAVVVLMLWLYLLGMAILIGGEINAEVAAAAGKEIVQDEGTHKPVKPEMNDEGLLKHS